MSQITMIISMYRSKNLSILRFIFRTVKPRKLLLIKHVNKWRKSIRGMSILKVYTVYFCTCQKPSVVILRERDMKNKHIWA